MRWEHEVIDSFEGRRISFMICLLNLIYVFIVTDDVFHLWGRDRTLEPIASSGYPVPNPSW
jgi:hypothetical protein